MGSCKTALNNIIASDRVHESDNPYSAFSEGILNFYSHYCEDDHTSSWCVHEKVCCHSKNIKTPRQLYMYMCIQEKDGKPYQTKHAFSCKASKSCCRVWQADPRIMSLSVDK